MVDHETELTDILQLASVAQASLQTTNKVRRDALAKAIDVSNKHYSRIESGNDRGAQELAKSGQLIKECLEEAQHVLRSGMQTAMEKAISDAETALLDKFTEVQRRSQIGEQKFGSARERTTGFFDAIRDNNQSRADNLLLATQESEQNYETIVSKLMETLEKYNVYYPSTTVHSPTQTEVQAVVTQTQTPIATSPTVFPIVTPTVDPTYGEDPVDPKTLASLSDQISSLFFYIDQPLCNKFVSRTELVRFFKDQRYDESDEQLQNRAQRVLGIFDIDEDSRLSEIEFHDFIMKRVSKSKDIDLVSKLIKVVREKLF